MFTALPFKIVVDSRQATLGTSSNFQVQLPETLHLDPDVVLYVNSATVTNTFLSTGTTVGSKSHNVYFYEKNGATLAFNRAQLPERGYVADELSDALESAMNLASIFGGGYTCVYNESKQTITISSSNPFFVVNDDLLNDPGLPAQVQPITAGSAAYALDFSNLESAHQLLGLGRGSSVNASFTELMTLLANNLGTTQETGAIDVRKVSNVFIHSEALSNHNCYGLGARTMLVKIPVFGNMGDILHRGATSHHLDFIDLGNKTLSLLDFEVRDSLNRPLNLRGGNVSIELLFTKRPL